VSLRAADGTRKPHTTPFIFHEAALIPRLSESDRLQTFHS